jgi:predicted MFS family arabinose efflux permease
VTSSDPVTHASSPKLSLGSRIVILGGSIFLTVAVVSVQPVLPHIESALAVTDNDKLLVKMLVSIMGLTMVLGAPLAGLLADRVSLGKLLTIAGLIYAIAGTSGLYLNNLYALLGSRLLVGLAAAGIATLSITFVNKRLQGHDRARWIGYHVSVAMISSLAAYPIAGYLGELGWRWTFIIYLLGLVLVAIAVLGLLDEPRMQRSTAPVKPAGDANPLRWFPLWYVPLAFAMGTITFSPGVYLPFVIRDIGVSSPSLIAWVMLADGVMGAAMSFMFGRSQRHLSSYVTFIICFGFTGTGLLVTALSSSITGIVIGTCIYGFGIGWFTASLVTSLSQRVTTGQQGRAVGFAKGIHYVAAPTCLLLLEPISRAAGPQGAIMAGAVLSFAAVVIFLCLAAGQSRRGPVASETLVGAD